MLAARVFVVVLGLLHLSQGNEEKDLRKRAINMGAVSRQVKNIMKTTNVPSAVAGALGALDKVTRILTCLPTKCSGRCCSSPDYCSIPQLASKVIRNPRAKFTLCRNPWSVRIDLDASFNLPWWAKLLKIKINPIVIPIDNRDTEGVLQMQSTTTLAKGSFLGIGLGKAKLEFDAFLRYDCTKPRNNPSLRKKYNSMYTDGKPGPDGNKLFYRINIKLKEYRKNFWCFCYKLKKTRTLVAKEDYFAEGPKSCNVPSG